MKMIATLLLLVTGTSFAGVSVDPIFTYGNYQVFDEIINLKPADSSLVELEETGDYGYDLLSTRKIFISAGLSSVSNISDNLYTSLGLFPSYNSYAKWSYKFSNKDELEAFEHKVPTSIAEVRNMNSGDAVYWNSLGGVALNLALGSGITSIGPKVAIEGGHSIYLEKKSENSIYLEIRRVSTRTIGILAGAFLAYAEVARMAEKTKGSSFLIDISTAQGEQLFEDMIQKGRIDYAQESDESKVKIGDVSSLKVLKSAKIVAATPFFPLLQFRRGRGMEVIEEDREDIWDNNTQVTRAISFKEGSVRIISKQIEMETAALVEEIIENDIITNKTQLYWFKKGNRFKVSSLKRALKKIESKTGLNFDIVLPEDNEKIGFAKISFSLTPSQAVFNAIRESHQLTTAKSTASFFQKFWKDEDKFSVIFDLVKRCGGSLSLEIAGEKITRLIQQTNYSELQNCQL